MIKKSNERKGHDRAQNQIQKEQKMNKGNGQSKRVNVKCKRQNCIVVVTKCQRKLRKETKTHVKFAQRNE